MTTSKLTPKRAGLTLAIAALVVLLVDQASKAWVLYGLDLEHFGEIEVWPPWFNLRMAWNRGINFGLFASGSEAARWVLIGLAVAISAGLTVWALRRRTSAFALGTGILVGGALGNALDRVVYGAVADFLNTSCCGFDNPYAFNVADVAIFLGAAVIALKG